MLFPGENCAGERREGDPYAYPEHAVHTLLARARPERFSGSLERLYGVFELDGIESVWRTRDHPEVLAFTIGSSFFPCSIEQATMSQTELYYVTMETLWGVTDRTFNRRRSSIARDLVETSAVL
jgi:hypothetical protein